MNERTVFTLKPIGRIEYREDNPCININNLHIRGLKQLEHFSHIRIFWHRTSGFNNKIGLKTCRISEIKEECIYLEYNSLPENTMIYDIKPYLPADDMVKEAKQPHEKQVKTFLSRYDKTHKTQKEEPADITIFPIGTIRQKGKKCFIEVKPEHNNEADFLRGYSHVNIVWYFNRFDSPQTRRMLVCTPPYDAPKTGVFACRAPVRPNPLALSVCRIITTGNDKGIIEISGNDAMDGTPVIHLKPYVNEEDRFPDAFVPEWLSHWPRFLQEENIVSNISSIKPAEIHRLKNYSTNIDQVGPEKDSDNRTDKQEIKKISNTISINGARQHNLKNVTVSIPMNKLTVITGVSGSGKSSLAFDTIYAESQRQYMQSLSGTAYSVFEKPDFDTITNLLPALAIEQKNLSRNPRSCVGSVSDIYSFLRLLFSRIGTRHCITCGREIVTVTVGSLVKQIKELNPLTKITLYPGKKPGKTCKSFIIQEDIKTDSNMLNDINETITGFYSSGRGFITLEINREEYICVSEREACTSCDAVYFKMSPSIFSYNSPEGMCPGCNGLGYKMKVDPDKVITSPEKSLLDHASPWYGNLRMHRDKPSANWMRSEILALAGAMEVDLELPWNKLPEEFRKKALYGSEGRKFTFSYKSEKTGRSGTIERPIGGAINHLTRLFQNSSSGNSHELYKSFISEGICEECSGERLSSQGRFVTLAGKRYPEIAGLSINLAFEWIDNLEHKISQNSLRIAENILEELKTRLKALMEVELSYLSLNRPVTTLSGGEAQRIRLARQLCCELSGLLYILDEPSTGLHPRDHSKIIHILKKIKDSGNTVVIVEHDEDTMLSADHLIDMGPGAGKYGGEIVAQGSIEDIIKNKKSLTGKYLKNPHSLSLRNKTREAKKIYLELEGASLHNLKNIAVKIPLGCMTCVTGVSGSGKSSLIQGVLVPAVVQELQGTKMKGENFRAVKGINHLDKIINVKQSPIGRTSRSTPATYIGVFDEIRNVFARTRGAKDKKIPAGRFSFNDKKGQCKTCNGLGSIKLEMNFLPDVWTICKDCEGKRYNTGILDICYKNKNISDVLNMDAIEAYDLFSAERRVLPFLKTMMDVGLDYIKLGQSSTSLSSGEAQRLKLALELSREETGKTLYILDEPTTGLHTADMEKLLKVLIRLCDMGNTVIVVEHNLNVISCADQIIDLGPEGGDNGGFLIGQGKPEDLMEINESFTGQFLKKYRCTS